MYSTQWCIQDFPDGGAKLQDRGANLIFGQICPENYMKLKEFGPKGVCIPGTPLQFCQCNYQWIVRIHVALSMHNAILHFSYPWIVHCYMANAKEHITYPWIVNSIIHVQLDELV